MHHHTKYHTPTYGITSSTQEERTLKLQCDEVISEVNVEGDEVIYEEVKMQRESDGTREQRQEPQWQQQLQQTRRILDHKKSIYIL